MTPVVSRVSLELGETTAKIATPADAAAVKSRVARLLAKSLTADAAVQIALVNNRGLQAEYNALGISEAEYVEASLPPSPSVSFERVTYHGDLDIERRLIGDLLQLLTLPRRTKIAETESVRLSTRRSKRRSGLRPRRGEPYRAVAALETGAFLVKARTSADAAAQLNRKLGETGAATKLDQARSSALYAEVATELAQARLDAGKQREALTRQLGLWGRDADYKLPSRLPGFPRSGQNPRSSRTRSASASTSSRRASNSTRSRRSSA